MTRKDRIAQIIQREDPAELMRECFHECACRGSSDGEAACSCEMTLRQVGSIFSIFMLRRGVLRRLKPANHEAPVR